MIKSAMFFYTFFTKLKNHHYMITFMIIILLKFNGVKCIR